MRKGKRRVTLAINVLSNTVILKSSYSIFSSSNNAKKLPIMRFMEAYTIRKANASHKIFLKKKN